MGERSYIIVSTDTTSCNSLALCGCTPNCFLSSSLNPITGSTNGLHNSDSVVLLGGSLCCATLIETCDNDFNICGLSGNPFFLKLCNTPHAITINSCDSTSVCGTGSASVVNIHSDYNLDIAFTNCAIITDCGGTPVGLTYANDYSLNYVPRSLVDKGYVDSVAVGLTIHEAAVVATTSGITLSGNQTIDGVLTTTGMRVLVKNQLSGATNGIYSASTGSWSRTTDYDGTPSGEVANGDLIPVTSGSTQNSSIWALTTMNPITVGVTPLIFTEFSTVVDVQAGTGIAITQIGGVHTVCADTTIARLADPFFTGVVTHTNNGGNLLALNSAGTYYGTIQNDDVNKWSLGYTTTQATLGTPVLTWCCTGNVGINCNAPSVALDVCGDIKASGCGTAIDWLGTSDCRIKTCICPICNALSTVMQLQGVSYQLCDDVNHEKRIGLIAQEVEKFLPEIVSYSKAEKCDIKYGITDNKLALNYDKLSAVLLEAIKEQQNQIDCLRQEITNIKNNSQ